MLGLSKWRAKCFTASCNMARFILTIVRNETTETRALQVPNLLLPQRGVCSISLRKHGSWAQQKCHGLRLVYRMVVSRVCRLVCIGKRRVFCKEPCSRMELSQWQPVYSVLLILLLPNNKDFNTVSYQNIDPQTFLSYSRPF